MSKIAVVYWSGTGNTEAMANFVAEGADVSRSRDRGHLLRRLLRRQGRRI